MERPNKHNYYLDICDSVLTRSTCLRRKFGAVIVNNDEIVSTGYNGAPHGTKNCCDTLHCERELKNIPSGQNYELCRAIHAEQNAIISAGRKLCEGATLYLSGIDAKTDEYIGNKIDCCIMCKRFIVNSGIKTVIMRISKNDYKEVDVNEWLTL